MNIMIAINEEFVEMCKTMLFSLFDNNKNEKISIYLLYDKLDNKWINNLKKFVWKMGGKLSAIKVDLDIFDEMPIVLSRFSVEMYYRIIAFKILPKDVDRILWLDSDIVVLSDVKEFYYQDLDGKCIAACEDAFCNTNDIKKIKEKMDIDKESRYFNSGVILFDLNKIRQSIKENEIVEIANKYMERLTYPDQDILNKLYQKKIKYDNAQKYNYQVNDIEKLENEGVVILHYSGNRKPWNVKRALAISKYYWKNRWKMGNYTETILFYIEYIILYLPKQFKMKIRKERGKN